MHTVWLQIQSILEKNLEPRQIQVWLSPLVPSWEQGDLILYAQNEFVASFVRGCYLSRLEEAAREVLKQPCRVSVRNGAGQKTAETSSPSRGGRASSPSERVGACGDLPTLFASFPTAEQDASGEGTSTPSEKTQAAGSMSLNRETHSRSGPPVSSLHEGRPVDSRVSSSFSGQSSVPYSLERTLSSGECPPYSGGASNKPPVYAPRMQKDTSAQQAAPKNLDASVSQQDASRPSAAYAPHEAGSPVFPRRAETEEVRKDDRGRPSPVPLPRSLYATQAPLPIPVMYGKAGQPGSVASLPVWRYSFADFVTGPSNELAYAASHSMCSGTMHADLLFLSSTPGLGKTHLLQAVGRSLCESCNRSNPRVEYLTAEEFASRFYYALKTQDTDSFKAHFRTLDLLLLEDVHFLQGKEKMQSELLATIKSLRDKGARLVFSGSFGPAELKFADEQLQSRLAAGLISSIERPDEDTRRRILRKKASLHQVLLPGDVEDVLARHINSDVRQLESCLQNLIFKARHYKSAITVDMAWEVLTHYAGHTPILNMDAIVSCVCQGFGLSREQLASQSRKQSYVSARNTAFYLARKHTDLSLEAIGRQFKRAHSTVIKGITNLEREISRQSPVGRQIENILAMVERNGALMLNRSYTK